jgi:hypothetical protein
MKLTATVYHCCHCLTFLGMLKSKEFLSWCNVVLVLHVNDVVCLEVGVFPLVRVTGVPNFLMDS